MNDASTGPLGGGPALAPFTWRTVIHRDGTRTLALAGQTIGHYSRIHYKHAKGRAAGWRGVTHRGTLVYAPTERRVRELLQTTWQGCG